MFLVKLPRVNNCILDHDKKNERFLFDEIILSLHNLLIKNLNMLKNMTKTLFAIECVDLFFVFTLPMEEEGRQFSGGVHSNRIINCWVKLLRAVKSKK